MDESRYEFAADLVGRNGMLKIFDGLKIARATADFYKRMETDVVRMIAVKPYSAP